MKKRNTLLITCLLSTALSSFAAVVDTVWVKSASMHKDVQVITVTPDAASGKNGTACPVIYLLHGYGGHAGTWMNIKPALPQIADEKGIIFVCPDGKNSWYWDSPQDTSYRYETFVSSELTTYVDSHYKTIPDRQHRAITGLSMGGHGAMWNAIRHHDIFGAAGTTSGGMDIRPFPKNWGMALQLGEYENNRQVWDEHTVINQTGRIKDGDLAIIIDCGEGDFFLTVNKNLHDRLLERHISHDFITRPGEHNGQYWANSIDYQILFFEKFFKR